MGAAWEGIFYMRGRCWQGQSPGNLCYFKAISSPHSLSVILKPEGQGSQFANCDARLEMRTSPTS